MRLSSCRRFLSSDLRYDPVLSYLLSSFRPSRISAHWREAIDRVFIQPQVVGALCFVARGCFRTEQCVALNQRTNKCTMVIGHGVMHR